MQQVAGHLVDEEIPNRALLAVNLLHSDQDAAFHTIPLPQV